MKLYNTLSRKIEELHTLDGRKPGDNPAPEVKLYACGPTVYDFTHLGHLRKYTMDDVLVRTLRSEGYQVRHVQNITDVGHLVSDDDEGEDKMEKGSRKHGKSATELAQEFEDFFFYSMDLMGNLRPTLSCRATDHIQSQLELVLDLEKKGLTYLIEGDGVYFDTSKIDDYGKLSGINPEMQMEGARVSKVVGKRNPTDFALWKFEKEGEERQMTWPSPWHPRSFPGWHVECSAMSIEHLGPQLDIHTGGIDHIPVHHENEIAQSEAYTGKEPFSQIWVHHNFLQVEGQKMSKSLGNFYTIDDLRSRGYSAKALRLLFLTSHYRSELNFTWESMTAAQKAYLRLLRAYLDIKKNLSEEQLEIEDFPEAKNIEEQFNQAMRNDLHTSEALSVLWSLLKTDLPAEIKYYLISKFDRVLGLGLVGMDEDKFSNFLTFAKNKGVVEEDFLVKTNEVEEEKVPQEVKDLFEKREVARKEKNWQEADLLRDQIEEFGFKLIDTQDGVKIKR